MYPAVRRAFTLIELLVVMAVIGILAGTIGMALRTGDRGPALQAAQATLSSLVSSARAKAALDGVTCTVLIWADPNDLETYLRRACVAQFVDTDNNNVADSWVRQGEVIDLPQGVFFAPGDMSGDFPAKWEKASDWSSPVLTLTESQLAGNIATTSLVFKMLDETGVTPVWISDPLATTKAYVSIAFDPVGNLVSKRGGTTVGTLAVATGELTPGDGVLFQQADSLRGLKLSDYGVPIVLNEKNAFK